MSTMARTCKFHLNCGILISFLFTLHVSTVYNNVLEGCSIEMAGWGFRQQERELRAVSLRVTRTLAFWPWGFLF